MDTLVRLVRMGDDFSLSGLRSLCNAFRDELGKHLLVKTTAVSDVQEAVHLNRLLARRMQQPNTKNMQARNVWFDFPRCLVVYNRQAEQPIVDIFSDSDWAGWHLLSASATTQTVVATCSGEAEFHALTKSASGALGAVAMVADVSKVLKPRVRVDATASKAIDSRRGVARVRHLHTQVLWVQEAVARRELTIVKAP